MAEHLLELRNITKSFGNVRAVDGVSLHVGETEIIGLLGDNGAGKSTLIKTIAGFHEPDSGELYAHGKKMSHWSVQAARRAGIETVYQDRALAEQQTIARNIFMGRERSGFLGFLRVKDEYAEAERLMRDIGFTSRVFRPDSIVGRLSGGERQGVAIARALYFKAKIIILDEPTNNLSLTETEKVFRFMEQIKHENSSCIFISHNIYHAYDSCDRFIIIDRGRVVQEMHKRDVPSAEVLVREMQAIARAADHAA